MDGAYPAEWLEEGVRGLKQAHNIDLESTTNPTRKGFKSYSLVVGLWTGLSPGFSMIVVIVEMMNGSRINSAAMIHLVIIYLVCC